MDQEFARYSEAGCVGSCYSIADKLSVLCSIYFQSFWSHRHGDLGHMNTLVQVFSCVRMVHEYRSSLSTMVKVGRTDIQKDDAIYESLDISNQDGETSYLGGCFASGLSARHYVSTTEYSICYVRLPKSKQ